MRTVTNYTRQRKLFAPDMNVIGAVLLCGCMCIYSGASGSITCRRCVTANSLVDCIGNVTCGDLESCYMDQAITAGALTIEYTGGCRATDVCLSAAGTHVGVGRWDLIACSRCCDIEAPGGCNAKLCGIKTSRMLTCRMCDHAASLAKCSFTSCSNTESCYMDEIITDQFEIKYNAGCRAKQVCPGAASVAVGKRVNEHIACSRCCDIEAPGGCNSKLCGIKTNELTCLRCYHAASLANCTAVTCSAAESCFMDQVVTEQLAIRFTAGCRAKDVCSVGGHRPIGKRSIEKRSELIACSRCCDTEAPGGCNAKLCGIRPNVLTCRRCNHAASLANCTTTSCSPTESCYMDKIITDQFEIKYNAGCRAKQVCVSAASAASVGVGKRANEHIACSRCCSEYKVNGCNSLLCGIRMK